MYAGGITVWAKASLATETRIPLRNGRALRIKQTFWSPWHGLRLVIMGTATSILECSTRYPWLGKVNCTAGSVAYGEFGSNPSITGIGVCILAWCCVLDVMKSLED